MTDTQGGEAAVVVTNDAAAQAASSSQEQVSTRDWESEAKDTGWRPQEEWGGKPENWKDAQTWVEHGETNTRLNKLEREYKARFESLEKVNSRTIEALQAQHAKEVADLKAERKTAIQAGDADKVEELDEQLEALKEKGAEKPKTAKTYDDYPDDYAPPAGSEEHDNMVSAFIKANAWMIDKPDMASYAEQWSFRNANANRGIGFKANMKATIEAVKREFPAYFNENNAPAANGHAAVDAGGSFTGGGRSDPLSRLPNEARAQAARDMKQFPKIYPNAEAWIKAYNG